ncbi:MAG: hypothetical protein ACRDF4_12110 [Rhabdochlamydiaceae bacterium]
MVDRAFLPSVTIPLPFFFAVRTDADDEGRSLLADSGISSSDPHLEHL